MEKKLIIKQNYKPTLAILEEHPKIKAYDESKKISKSRNVIQQILILLGVVDKGNDRQLHYAAVQQMIVTDYSNYTFEEIIEAFKLAISGKLGLELYSKLDPLIFGKVMQKYAEHKIEALSRWKKEQREKRKEQEYENMLSGHELTYDEIYPILLYAKKHYEENGTIGYGHNFLYGVLKKLGKLELSDSSKRRIMAIAEVDMELHNKGELKKRKRDRVIESKKKNGKYTPEFIIRCENIALGEWLIAFYKD